MIFDGCVRLVHNDYCAGFKRILYESSPADGTSSPHDLPPLLAKRLSLPLWQLVVSEEQRSARLVPCTFVHLSGQPGHHSAIGAGMLSTHIIYHHACVTCMCNSSNIFIPLM